MLAAGFVHLLPDAEQALQSLSQQWDVPFAQALAGFAFILVFYIETAFSPAQPSEDQEGISHRPIHNHHPLLHIVVDRHCCPSLITRRGGGTKRGGKTYGAIGGVNAERKGRRRIGKAKLYGSVAGMGAVRDGEAGRGVVSPVAVVEGIEEGEGGMGALAIPVVVDEVSGLGEEGEATGSGLHGEASGVHDRGKGLLSHPEGASSGTSGEALRLHREERGGASPEAARSGRGGQRLAGEEGLAAEEAPLVAKELSPVPRGGGEHHSRAGGWTYVYTCGIAYVMDGHGT